MTAQHDVPGGWVAVLDPEEVSVKRRRTVDAIKRKMAALPGMRYITEHAKAAGATGGAEVQKWADAHEAELLEFLPETAGLHDELADAVVMSRIVQWSFEAPLTVDSLTDFPQDRYDAIRALCPDVEDESAEPTDDQTSPTGPSTA